MDDQKSAVPAEYEVTQAREIGGVHRAVGETVTLMPAQVKYYLPPYGTGLKVPGSSFLDKPKANAEKLRAKFSKSED